jgi:hypothetical protein
MRHIKTFEKYGQVNESWKNTLSGILLGLSTLLSSSSKSQDILTNPGSPASPIWQAQQQINNQDGGYSDNTEAYIESYRILLIREVNKINIDNDTLYQKIKNEINKDDINTKLVKRYLKQAIGESKYDDLDSIYKSFDINSDYGDKQSLLNCIDDLNQISHYQTNKDLKKYFLILVLIIICTCVMVPLLKDAISKTRD